MSLLWNVWDWRCFGYWIFFRFGEYLHIYHEIPWGWEPSLAIKFLCVFYSPYSQSLKVILCNILSASFPCDSHQEEVGCGVLHLWWHVGTQNIWDRGWGCSSVLGRACCMHRVLGWNLKLFIQTLAFGLGMLSLDLDFPPRWWGPWVRPPTPFTFALLSCTAYEHITVLHFSSLFLEIHFWVLMCI